MEGAEPWLTWTSIAGISKLFQDLVCITLDSDKQVLAGVPLKGNQFTREIKNRSDIHLLEVTLANRDHLLETIVVQNP